MIEASAGSPNESVRFEETDFNPRAIRWFVAGLIALLVVTALICAGLLRAFLSLSPRIGERPPSVPLARTETPLPWTEPSAYLQRVREREARILNSYGWVDRKNGIARIPIGEAMRILVSQGMPATRQVPDTPAIPPVKSKPSLPPPVSQRAGDEFGDTEW